MKVGEMLSFVHRFWPVLMMAVTIVTVCMIPIEHEKNILVEPSADDSVTAFLTAPVFVVCVSATVLALSWAYTACHASSMPDMEQMAMVWHLTNGTW
jgi:hypothetical protein